MNKIYIPLASLAYLLFISIGTISVIDVSWSPFQILIGVTLISFSFFFFVNIKSVNKISTIINTNKATSIKMSCYVLLMLVPIFITEKHGVSPVFYTIVFSSIFPAIAYLSSKNYIKSSILFCLVICVFIFDNHSLYGYLVGIGPVSAYFLLMNSKKLSKHTSVTTSQVMLIRYFVLAFICLFLVPLAGFSVSNFNVADIITILIIAIFLNIIPIYCSQYIALVKDPGYLGKVTSLAPLSVFIICLTFYNKSLLTMTELFFSIALSTIMFLYLIKRQGL